MRLGRATLSDYWLLILPLILLLGLLYVVPILQVLWISVSDPEPGFGNYALLWEARAVRRVLATTLRICALTTALAVGFGYVIAYAMTHVSDRHRTWMLMFVLVPFWVSVLVRGFAWLTLLSDNGVVNGWLMGLGLTAEPVELVRNEIGVTIGMVHYMIPYAVLPLYANMATIDRRLVAAARGLGCGPFEAFRRVFLPLTVPGIVGAALLVFIFSLGFYVTPVILGGGRTVLIAEYVATQILQITRWGAGTMLATVLLVAILAMLAVVSRFVDLRQLFGAK